MDGRDPYQPTADYYVHQNVMMAPTTTLSSTIVMKSSSMPATTTNGPLFLAGTYPSTRGNVANLNTASVTMAEVVSSEWDRGRHQLYGSGGGVKFPMEQAVLVGVGGGYEYTNTYEYEYPPIVMSGPPPSQYGQHHHHHHRAKMAAGAAPMHHTNGG